MDVLDPTELAPDDRGILVSGDDIQLFGCEPPMFTLGVSYPLS